jgi:cytochrome c oxidase subunit 2
MNRLTSGLATLLTATALVVPAQNVPPAAGETGQIKVTAKKYEFNPNVIRVKKGDHVKLVITALDRLHGFKLEAFHIDRKLPKGEAVAIEFTADQAGTFPFACSQFCGLGHSRMKGKLIVE